MWYFNFQRGKYVVIGKGKMLSKWFEERNQLKKEPIEVDGDLAVI